MTGAQRAARLVAEWRHRRETGAQETAADLLHAHPDLVAELRLHLDLQQLLEGVAHATAPPEVDPAPPLRERIGDFRLLREIGRGGMGVVYEAEQVSMRRSVALKVLVPGVSLSPKAVERFQREAQAAGRLHHTNIVAVYAMGEDDGVFFYAMERIEGRTLAAVIADLVRLGGRPPPPGGSDPSSWVTTGGTGRAFFSRAAAAFAGVAEALGHAHAAGIIHRDVKPSNVMLDSEGVLKLTDFGLARLEEGSLTLTMTGDVLGTPAYMSPEQIRPGAQALDARADVYSLGATLYEFLTLRPPFQGATPQGLFARILSEDVRPPRRWNPRIPKDLDTIVSKAMERNPARRYQTAAELADDLRHFAEGSGIRARRAGPIARAWKRVCRNKIQAGAIALALIALGTSAGWNWTAARARARQRTAEYVSLVERSQELELLGSVLGNDLTRVRDPAMGLSWLKDLEQAISIEPGRPEAYLARSLSGERSSEERMADLDRASALGGVGPRTFHTMRASILREAGRTREAEEEEAAAERHPRLSDGTSLSVEARAALLRADRKAALPLLSTLVELSAHGDPVRAAALYARARVRESDGDLAGALEDLASARPVRGQLSLQLSAHIASLWRRLGKPEQGEALFRQALETARGAGDAWSWKNLCAALAELREYPWLAEATGEALRAHPREVYLLTERARALQFSGGAGALEAIRAAAGLAPDSLDVRGMHLAILFESRLFTEVVALAERILLKSPDDAAALQIGGMAWVFAGRPEAGLALLERSVRASPTSHEAHCNHAQALAELGRWPAAQVAATLALELDPLCPHMLVVRARGFIAGHQFQEALAETDKAIAATPRFDLAHLTRGQALANLERWQEALQEFETVVGLDPGGRNGGYAREFGMRALLALGRPDDALRLMVEVDARHGATAHVSLNRAMLLAHLGRGEAALQVLDEGTVRSPGAATDFADARYTVLRMLGRLEDARSLAREFVATRPDADPLVRACWMAFVGDAAGARAVLANLPAPSSPPDAYNRACLHALLGEADAAIQWLQVALQAGIRTSLPDEDFALIRQDPRFRPLERMQLGR